MPRPHAANRAVGLSRAIPLRCSTPPGRPASPRGPSAATKSLVVHAYITQVDFGFGRDDLGLLVMPMCHANSIFFIFAFASCGAALLRLRPQALRPRASAGDACRRPVHLHLARADPLHHDARAARGGEEQLRRRQRHQAPDLLRTGAARDQACAHGVFPQLAALRRLRFDRDGLGHAPSPRRAAHQARLDRARDDRHRPDQAPRCRRKRGRRRRARRDLCAYALCVPGILEAAGKDGGGLSRRLLHGRRHRPARRRRLPLSGRPQEQHDHQRRRERLSLRGRAGRSAPTPRSRMSPSSAFPTRNGERRPTRSSSCMPARPPPRPTSSNGAGTRSPATSGRNRCRSSPKTTCRGPRPGRYFIGCCASDTPRGASPASTRGPRDERDDQGERGAVGRRHGKKPPAPCSRAMAPTPVHGDGGGEGRRRRARRPGARSRRA